MQQSSYSQLCSTVLNQVRGVLYKNYCNHMSNKKKLAGELVMPLIVSVIYAVLQSNNKEDGNVVLVVVLTMLLKIYLGLVGVSAVRELVNLFIVERNEQFRQYQHIFGLSNHMHTISNLFYMCIYLSATVLPLYLTVSWFGVELVHILYFGAFVISNCTLAMALTAFFTDHKIALELIGMCFSLSAFLVFFYQPEGPSSPSGYLALIMPNSSFAIALLYHDIRAPLYSLLAVKVYLIVYFIFEFPEYLKEKMCGCWGKVSHYLPALGRQSTQLTEEFELNEVVHSDLENDGMARGPAIRTEGLVKTYKAGANTVHALNNVTINIKERSIFGLLGRNGAGKTTLVDILTGVTPPSSGSYVLPPNSSIGICYQHEILYESLTVEEHLWVYSLLKPLKFGGEQRQEHIDQIISTLGIEGQRKKMMKELSGGNKRKLSIAIAIIGHPKVLIFDEPTSGLDPLSRMHVWDIFSSLREMRSTIILTTHHLDEAEKLSDWVCVIERGSVIVENTAQQIKQKYGKGYHLSLHTENIPTFDEIQHFKTVVEKNGLKHGQFEHQGKEVNMLVKPSSRQVPGRVFEGQFVSLVEELQKEGVVFNFHSNTLEQSFIAIIKDNDSSSDSLGEGVSIHREDPSSSSSYNILQKWCFQLWGVIIKNIYFNKSILLQSIIIYNINILILLISDFFNQFLGQYLNQQTDVPVKNSNNANLNVVQGYLIMATAFIHAPVYEKEFKIRATLNTRGLSPVIYWLGHFLFDFSLFMLNLTLVAKIFAPETVQELGWESLVRLGVGAILYTYCFSFLFGKTKTASTWFSLINIIFGLVILPLIIFGQQTFLGNLAFIKYFYPYYDLSVMVLFQDNPATATLSQAMHIQKPTGSTILINIGVYLTLLICLEAKVIQRIKNVFQTQEGDDTVRQSIKLVNISKSYGKIQALKNVSYEADEERLALLGHNGAGKSTTFGLLSAQLNADSGQLYLQKNFHKTHQKGLNSTGICYQEDSLWEGVLVHQIIKIFSYLVPIRGAENEILWLFQSLQYDSNNNFKRFKNLSGGNKRKLCMMIALFGDPMVRLLDQCSTGLDPSSRLAMIDTIKASRRGTTVFTTHSMSQAERLCRKAVIMGKGKVLEYDLISSMKSRYFSCCWIDLKVTGGEEEQTLKDIIRGELFTDGISQKLTERGSMRVEVQKQLVQMSKVLRTVAILKEKGIVDSFSVVEPKLEDVYIQATRDDEVESPEQSNQTDLVQL